MYMSVQGPLRQALNQYNMIGASSTPLDSNDFLENLDLCDGRPIRRIFPQEEHSHHSVKESSDANEVPHGPIATNAHGHFCTFIKLHFSIGRIEDVLPNITPRQPQNNKPFTMSSSSGLLPIPQSRNSCMSHCRMWVSRYTKQGHMTYSSSAAGKCHTSAPRWWEGNRARRYRPARFDHILLRHYNCSDSSRHHWHSFPY